ncbi:uncharacterized protein LOC144236974 [Crocuta crocuta]
MAQLTRRKSVLSPNLQALTRPLFLAPIHSRFYSVGDRVVRLLGGPSLLSFTSDVAVSRPVPSEGLRLGPAQTCWGGSYRAAAGAGRPQDRSRDRTAADAQRLRRVPAHPRESARGRVAAGNPRTPDPLCSWGVALPASAAPGLKGRAPGVSVLLGTPLGRALCNTWEWMCSLLRHGSGHPDKKMPK